MTKVQDYVYVVGAGDSVDRQERPYQHDSTTSRPLCEVKDARARLVLRWGTTLESRVLFFWPFLVYIQVFASMRLEERTRKKDLSEVVWNSSSLFSLYFLYFLYSLYSLYFLYPYTPSTPSTSSGERLCAVKDEIYLSTPTYVTEPLGRKEAKGCSLTSI